MRNFKIYFLSSINNYSHHVVHCVFDHLHTFFLLILSLSLLISYHFNRYKWIYLVSFEIKIDMGLKYGLQFPTGQDPTYSIQPYLLLSVSYTYPSSSFLNRCCSLLLQGFYTFYFIFWNIFSSHFLLLPILIWINGL